MNLSFKLSILMTTETPLGKVDTSSLILSSKKNNLVSLANSAISFFIFTKVIRLIKLTQVLSFFSLSFISSIFLVLFFLNALTPKYPTTAPTPAKTHPPFTNTMVPSTFPATPNDPPSVAPMAAPPIAPILSLVPTACETFPTGDCFSSSSFFNAASLFAKNSASLLFNSASSSACAFFFLFLFYRKKLIRLKMKK